MSPDEIEKIRADERARVIYYLQRRFRIIVKVREEYYPAATHGLQGEQEILDMIGWLADELNPEGFPLPEGHYDFVVPPNNETPRAIERNVWKIKWQ